MKRFEEGLKQLRSSEVLTPREMEIPDFSFACSWRNGDIQLLFYSSILNWPCPFSAISLSFYRRDRLHRMPNGYSTY